jgi:hypothetical protein
METTAFEVESVLIARQWQEGTEVLLVFHFAGQRRSLELPFPRGEWHKRLDSADACWAGPGSLAPAAISCAGRAGLEMPAASFVLYQRPPTD